MPGVLGEEGIGGDEGWEGLGGVLRLGGGAVVEEEGVDVGEDALAIGEGFGEVGS